MWKKAGAWWGFWMLAYGQPTATPRGDGENPQSYPEEQTLGLGKMGVQGGGEIWFGKRDAQPRTPEKVTKKRHLDDTVPLTGVQGQGGAERC